MEFFNKIKAMPAWKALFIIMVVGGFVIIGTEEYFLRKTFHIINVLVTAITTKSPAEEAAEKAREASEKAFNDDFYTMMHNVENHMNQTKEKLERIHNHLANNFDAAAKRFNKHINEKERSFNKAHEELDNIDESIMNQGKKERDKDLCDTYLKTVDAKKSKRNHDYWMAVLDTHDLDEAIKNKTFDPSQCEKDTL